MVDIVHGPSHDLTTWEVRQRWTARIARNEFAACGLAPVCTSFSRLLQPPVRDGQTCELLARSRLPTKVGRTTGAEYAQRHEALTSAALDLLEACDLLEAYVPGDGWSTWLTVYTGLHTTSHLGRCGNVGSAMLDHHRSDANRPREPLPSRPPNSKGQRARPPNSMVTGQGQGHPSLGEGAGPEPTPHSNRTRIQTRTPRPCYTAGPRARSTHLHLTAHRIAQPQVPRVRPTRHRRRSSRST
jgi:hypothetical protein